VNKNKQSGAIRLKRARTNPMNNPKTETNRFITRGTKLTLLALLMGIAVMSPAWLIGRAGEKHHHDKNKGDKHHGDEHHAIAYAYRWDIIHVSSLGTNTVLDAGGVASDKAADGSQITLTGSGTWLSIPGRDKPQAVTGGGTWKTFDSTGTNSTGSGNYEVTRLVSSEVFPGSNQTGAPDIDHIGSLESSRGGLIVLRIVYSDGERGVLTVSCHGPLRVPDTVFEGITVTKGIVGYVDRGKPAPGVDANRTVFHLLADVQVDDDDDDDDDP